MMSGTIFLTLLRVFVISHYWFTTCLSILTTVIWVMLGCSRKKPELSPAQPLVKGPKHLDVEETQRNTSSEKKVKNIKPSEPLKTAASNGKINAEENEPNPIAASLKCGRTQGSNTIPVLPSDDTTKHVESLPESSG